MAQYLWLIYALSAAIMWGLGYALSEKLLRMGLTPTFMLVVSSLIMLPVLITIHWLGGEKNQWLHLFTNKKALLLTITMAFLIIGGNLLILASIRDKNATLATLIEISYPFFTCIFAWLLFGEMQLNVRQMLGGLAILFGVFMIFLGS